MRTRISHCELCEPRLLLTAIGLLPHDIFVSDVVKVSSLNAVDLDDDGDVDLLSSSSGDGRIAWYENVDGRGGFQQRLVTSSLIRVSSVIAADLDGDRDLDLIAGSFAEDTKAVWLENLNGVGDFAEEHLIASDLGRVEQVRAADLDVDGDTDVILSSPQNGIIAWYENTDGSGRLGPRQIAVEFSRGPVVLDVADLNADGNPDLVLGTGSHRVMWHENKLITDGRFSDPIIAAEVSSPSSVSAPDLDGDGDLDILSTSRDGVMWHESNNGAESFASMQIATFSDLRHPLSADAGDLDGDGDLDVISASNYDNQVAWYENTDGQGRYGPKRLISVDARSVHFTLAADFDGDGDIDVASAAIGTIAWYENLDGSGSFGPLRPVTTSLNETRSVQAIDLEGDGDLDVVANDTAEGQIVWYENLDGQGAFGPQQLIAMPEHVKVFAADLDGDGLVDVISANLNGTFTWYRNAGKANPFQPQPTIHVDDVWGEDVYAMDADGDGDLDLFTSSYRTLSWHENTDGRGRFGPPQIIANNLHHGLSLTSGDLNSDGNLDILSTSWLDGALFWHAGDGQGGFGDQQQFFASNRSVVVADADGDGDMDVFTSGDSGLLWHENTDGRGTFINHLLDQVFNSATVRAVDMDGDGDIDLVYDATYGIGAWYENTDGQGTFDQKHPFAVWSYGQQAMDTADVDGDGDFDVILSPFYEGRILWYENRLLGDANGDGVFNSSDLVKVFQAGKYEDDIPNNATFDEGDWNGDGDFDSGDLVFAFQAGHYLVAATPSKIHIDAAIDWLFAHDDDMTKGRAFSAGTWAALTQGVISAQRWCHSFEETTPKR